MTNLTDLERAAIRGIMESQYNNLAPDDSEPIWSWDISYVPARQVGGVVSSLVKKGLAQTNGETKSSERTVWLTEAGVAEYRALAAGNEA